MAPRRNVFGYAIRPPLKCLEERRVASYIKEELRQLFTYLTSSPTKSERVCSRFLRLARTASTQTQVERLGYQALVEEQGLTRHIASRLKKRAQKIVDQISSWVDGTDVLDVGCGDGLVGTILSQMGKRVSLYDVYNYLDPHSIRNFVKGKEGRPLPYETGFDTVLLLTVLHHSLDPHKLLRITDKLVGRRLIVIESVFGVDPNHVGGSTANNPATAIFSEMDRECQLMFITFFDWFYNRVLHRHVSVPFNFNTPEEWHRIFTNHGYEVSEMIDFGIDQPLVPEYHVLFVLDKSRRNPAHAQATAKRKNNQRA